MLARFARVVRGCRSVVLVCGSLVFVACSSGGGSGGQGTPPIVRNWQEGVFFNSANYDDLCVNPRSGTNPLSGAPVPDRQGRFIDENNWLRSIHNEFYLWYDEIIDQDPANFPTAINYFPELRTPEFSDTGSGADKDNFHSAINTQTFADIILSGIDAGYGVQFLARGSAPNREVIVAYVEPGTEAATMGLSRGVQIITIDGETVADSTNVNILNNGLSPATLGETHSFTIQQLDNSQSDITLTSTEVSMTPVRNVGVVNGTNVGYILFNDHIATAETLLIDAINTLNGLGANQDVIIDLRYNGGGFLDLASELAYMLAGEAATDNKVFERLQFNDKLQGIPFNPLNGDNLLTPFHSTVQGFSNNLTAGDPLPTLNAANVVVITSEQTCSASEAIINGLRGADVNVIQIGTTTCGKPYGSVPLDNCGTTYLFTQFEGFNNKNEGEYSDGFRPDNSASFGVAVQGCEVADDLSNPLGDPNEENVANALNFLEFGTCLSAPMTIVNSFSSNKVIDPAPQTSDLSISKPLNHKIKF